MAKWWTARKGVKIYKKKKLRSGRLGGVSPSENIDSPNVKGHIISGYTGEKVAVYDEPPFKIPLGTNSESIKHRFEEKKSELNGNLLLKLCLNAKSKHKSSEFNYE